MGAGEPQRRILATGFRAQHFLAARQAWSSGPLRPRLLHYVAVTPAPPVVDDPALARQLQGLTPGFHRLSFDQGRVLLTICVGELAAMLRELVFHADSVVLDDPRQQGLAKALTRLSRRGTTLSGAPLGEPMRQELRACGWQIDGDGARYDPAWEPRRSQEEGAQAAGDAIMIGAGLAGAAVAASLSRRGWSVRVLDAASAPAAGASSLPAGLLAPHQSPDDNLLSRLTRAGIRITLQEARDRLARGLEWEPTGVLERRGEDPRPLPDVGPALAPWSRLASEAQRRAAGLDASQTAWWHENAAWIEPAALVRSWLREPGVRFVSGSLVTALHPQGVRWQVDTAAGGQLQADLVVVAAAFDSAALLAGRAELHPVRGQLTWAARGEASAALPPFPVNGNGHFLPDVPLLERGAWITGSTYGRADADGSVRGADTAANLQRARELLPMAAPALDAAAARGELRAWSAVRCASSDRRPLVGEVAPGLWVSTAMGSRGLTFAALCAELLAARLHQEPLPLEARLAQALDAGR